MYLIPLAFIPALLAFAWWAVQVFAISYGIAYLGGVLFGSDVPEVDAGPTADSQSRSWNPHSTQQEGIARPRAYGKNIHHGNIVAKWTDVVSNREVLYMIVEHGDGPMKGVVEVDGVKQIFLNDQPVSNFTSVEIQERLGTINQTYMTGFEKTKLEHEQNNIKLEKDVPVIVTTPNDFFDDLEYTILWPSGLYRHGRDGKIKLGFCRVQVHIREHPDGEWHEVYDHNNQLKVTHPLFMAHTVSDLWDNVERGKQYDLKFTNKTGPLTRHINEVCLRSFREVVEVAFTRPGKALMGIRAIATARLSGRLDVKVIREDKLVHVYDGTPPSWSIKYSRNRAWVTYDAFAQPVIDGDGTPEHPWVIKHYEGLDPARLDLEFFYAWAQFCSTQVPDGYGGTEDRIACDTILDFQTDVWSFVNELANIGRAHLYWQGHTLTGWIDTTVAAVSGLVTMDNVMARSWKNAWSEKNKLAGKVEVFFQDSRQGYERMPATLPNESAGCYTNIISIEGIGITTRGTAIHVANHALMRNELIRNVNSFRQYKDGFRHNLGDVIRLQCRIPHWGESYRVVKSTAANKVTLDRVCDAVADDELFIQVYDAVYEKVRVDNYIVASVSGKVVTITTTWDVTPVKNYMVAIGDVKLRRITKMDLRSDNYFDIEVETYDTDLFTADDMVPDNPDQNYIWDKPANPLTRPVTMDDVITKINEMMPPPTDVDAPVTSNCTWTGSLGTTVSWSATDAGDPIVFRYKGVSYEIDEDSTTDEFIYWDPGDSSKFKHTNNAAVVVALGKWYMCRNIDGVAWPTTPFMAVHAGVLQAGTITAALGQIGNLAVDTLQIAGEAVTLMVATYTAGQLSYTDSTAWHEAQTITMDMTGAPVMLIAAVQWSGLGAGGINIRIQRDDSTTIYSANMNDVGQFGNPFCVAIVDEDPGTGEHIYDLDIATTHNETPKEWLKFKSRSLVGQEVKK